MGGSSVPPPNPSSNATSIESRLEVLRQSVKGLPYTGGVQALNGEDLIVYYEVDDQSHTSVSRIDFRNATEQDLSAFATACQITHSDHEFPETTSMHPSRFAVRLDGVVTALLDVISPDLMQWQSFASNKSLRAEMGQINVYGPGSFTKPCKNTSSDNTLIGSLVVVFPTAHTGGALSIEQGATVWTFDPAAELSSITASSPAISYFGGGGGASDDDDDLDDVLGRILEAGTHYVWAQRFVVRLISTKH
ncbi:hypothetical protein B0H11DRAFT_449801 [Mycena galericulata]|nr:hypothetical protein B0H11DRAFT_449801 [Mycena galericulata]